MNKCYQEFASHANGTKGYALISGPGGHASQARIHKGQGLRVNLPGCLALKVEGGSFVRKVHMLMSGITCLMQLSTTNPNE